MDFTLNQGKDMCSLKMFYSLEFLMNVATVVFTLAKLNQSKKKKKTKKNSKFQQKC